MGTFGNFRDDNFSSIKAVKPTTFGVVWKDLFLEILEPFVSVQDTPKCSFSLSGRGFQDLTEFANTCTKKESVDETFGGLSSSTHPTQNSLVKTVWITFTYLPSKFRIIYIVCEYT